jgi:serine/threonine protein kinase
MNLKLKSVLRIGKEMVLSNFGSALFLKSIEGVNAIGGTCSEMCTGIMPPEMIAKVDLSNRDGFQQLMWYWRYLHNDASFLQSFSPLERQSISQFVESNSYEEPKDKMNEQNKWKENISSLLEKVRFEELPPALSQSTSFNNFCLIWEKMCQNYSMWENRVRPRIDEENQCAYMMKNFENRPNRPHQDPLQLPYKLVPPSEKVDVWIFGIFIYELCSGSNLFHKGYKGDLQGVKAYSKLYGWDGSATEKSVREHVRDPLAQDLLCHILVPAEERLSSVAEVLNHPFFAPKSVEAQRYLEKVTEIQVFSMLPRHKKTSLC